MSHSHALFVELAKTKDAKFNVKLKTTKMSTRKKIGAQQTVYFRGKLQQISHYICYETELYGYRSNLLIYSCPREALGPSPLRSSKLLKVNFSAVFESK